MSIRLKSELIIAFSLIYQTKKCLSKGCEGISLKIWAAESHPFWEQNVSILRSQRLQCRCGLVVYQRSCSATWVKCQVFWSKEQDRVLLNYSLGEEGVSGRRPVRGSILALHSCRQLGVPGRGSRESGDAPKTCFPSCCHHSNGSAFSPLHSSQLSCRTFSKYMLIDMLIEQILTECSPLRSSRSTGHCSGLWDMQWAR